MELEDQILHAGVVVCVAGVLMPWFGGDWSGTQTLWTGLGFYTAYIGWGVLLMQLFLLLSMLVPLIGGPVLLRRTIRHTVRLILCFSSLILLLAALSVLIRVTFEFSGVDVRFGIYLSLVGSGISTLYAFLRYQEQNKTASQEQFRHPDEKPVVRTPELDDTLPPPPPPPPPAAVEDHHPSITR